MQGKPRSIKSDDLTYIFFQIRATRCSKTRRSWQRRARLALAKRTDLTAAEKHEICSVWSRSNVAQIDSPALSKLFNREHHPQPHQTVTARSCTRRRFDVPSVDCSVSRSSHAVDIAPQHQANCKPKSVLFAPAKLLFQGYIYQRLPRGSALQPLLSDSRENQRRRRGRKPESCKPQKTRIARLNSVSQQNPFKKTFSQSARNVL